MTVDVLEKKARITEKFGRSDVTEERLKEIGFVMSEGETVRFSVRFLEFRRIQVCVRFHPQRMRLMARVAKVSLSFIYFRYFTTTSV